MRISRRRASGFLFGALDVSLSRGAACSAAGTYAGVDELKIPSEVLAQLEQNVPGVLEQARWLEELPLDGLAPGFVFIPR
jgi:hypothetical protein